MEAKTESEVCSRQLAKGAYSSRESEQQRECRQQLDEQRRKLAYQQDTASCTPPPSKHLRQHPEIMSSKVYLQSFFPWYLLLVQRSELYFGFSFKIGKDYNINLVLVLITKSQKGY